MTEGAFQEIVDDFNDSQDRIEVSLQSAPFSTVQQETIANAATGQLADVVGLDGSFLAPLIAQDALVDLTDRVAGEEVDGNPLARTQPVDQLDYSVPVVNFAYPLFVNNSLLEEAGVEIPTTREEFLEAARAVSAMDGDTSGFVLPLGTNNPNGVQNDIMSWVWASGGSVLQDGQPHLTDNEQVTQATDLVRTLVQDGYVIPGPETLQEVDKVNNFMNGRVAMMLDSTAHLAALNDEAPDMDISVVPVPAAADAEDPHGITAASWAAGISASSDHPDEAWEFIEYLMGQDVNAAMASASGGFPNNADAEPEFTLPHSEEAFEVYSNSVPTNEFDGLPDAQELMREYLDELQPALQSDIPTAEMLQNVQTAWESHF